MDVPNLQILLCLDIISVRKSHTLFLASWLSVNFNPKLLANFHLRSCGVMTGGTPQMFRIWQREMQDMAYNMYIWYMK